MNKVLLIITGLLFTINVYSQNRIIKQGGIIVDTISPTRLSPNGATNGQVLKWNGTAWVPQADNTGTVSEPSGQVVYGTGTGIDSENRFRYDGYTQINKASQSNSTPLQVITTDTSFATSNYFTPKELNVQGMTRRVWSDPRYGRFGNWREFISWDNSINNTGTKPDTTGNLIYNRGFNFLIDPQHNSKRPTVYESVEWSWRAPGENKNMWEWHIEAVDTLGRIYRPYSMAHNVDGSFGTFGISADQTFTYGTPGYGGNSNIWESKSFTTGIYSYGHKFQNQIRNDGQNYPIIEKYRKNRTVFQNIIGMSNNNKDVVLVGDSAGINVINRLIFTVNSPPSGNPKIVSSTGSLLIDSTLLLTKSNDANGYSIGMSSFSTADIMYQHYNGTGYYLSKNNASQPFFVHKNAPTYSFYVNNAGKVGINNNGPGVGTFDVIQQSNDFLGGIGLRSTGNNYGVFFRDNSNNMFLSENSLTRYAFLAGGIFKSYGKLVAGDASVLLQTTPGIEITNNGGTSAIFRYNASPEGAITANPGDMAIVNISGVGSSWIKRSGSGNTGWEQTITAGSGSITGSGSDEQVAIFNGTNTIYGNSNLIWKNSAIRLGIGDPSPNAGLSIKSDGGGVNEFIALRKGGTDWRMWVSDAETSAPSMRVGGNSASTWAWQFGWTGLTAHIFKSPPNSAAQPIMELKAQPSQSANLLMGSSSTGTADLFVFNNSGKLGLNQSSPTELLELGGTSAGIKFTSTSNTLSDKTLYHTTKDILRFGSSRSIDHRNIREITINQDSVYASGTYWDVAQLSMEFGGLELILESSGNSQGSYQVFKVPTTYANDWLSNYGVSPSNDVWYYMSSSEAYSRSWGDNFLANYKIAYKVNGPTLSIRLVNTSSTALDGGLVNVYGNASVKIGMRFSEGAKGNNAPAIITTSGTGMTLPTIYMPTVITGPNGRSVVRNGMSIGEGIKSYAAPTNGLAVQGNVGINLGASSATPQDELHVGGYIRSNNLNAAYEGILYANSDGRILKSTRTLNDYTSNTGIATRIPYWTTSSQWGHDDVFTYNATTNVLSAGNRVEIPSNATDARVFKSNSLLLSSRSNNNTWISDNIQYNGGWKYENAGLGSQIYFLNGQIQFRTFPSGTAGASITSETANTRMKIMNDGKVAVGYGAGDPGYQFDVNLPSGAAPYGYAARVQNGLKLERTDNPAAGASYGNSYALKLDHNLNSDPSTGFNHEITGANYNVILNASENNGGNVNGQAFTAAITGNNDVTFSQAFGIYNFMQGKKNQWSQHYLMFARMDDRAVTSPAGDVGIIQGIRMDINKYGTGVSNGTGAPTGLNSSVGTYEPTKKWRKATGVYANVSAATTVIGVDSRTTAADATPDSCSVNQMINNRMIMLNNHSTRRVATGTGIELTLGGRYNSLRGIYMLNSGTSQYTTLGRAIDLELSWDSTSHIIYSTANAPSYFVGRMGLGTANPSEALHVVGKIRNSNLSGSGDQVIYADANGVIKRTSFSISSLGGIPNLQSVTNVGYITSRSIRSDSFLHVRNALPSSGLRLQNTDATGNVGRTWEVSSTNEGQFYIKRSDLSRPTLKFTGNTSAFNGVGYFGGKLPTGEGTLFAVDSSTSIIPNIQVENKLDAAGGANAWFTAKIAHDGSETAPVYAGTKYETGGFSSVTYVNPGAGFMGIEVGTTSPEGGIKAMSIDDSGNIALGQGDSFDPNADVFPPGLYLTNGLLNANYITHTTSVTLSTTAPNFVNIFDGTTLTCTLPTPADNNRRMFYVKFKNAGTITGHIDNVSGASLSVASGEVYLFFCDGTTYWKLNN